MQALSNFIDIYRLKGKQLAKKKIYYSNTGLVLL